MAGRKVPDNGNFITAVIVYRASIGSDDAGPTAVAETITIGADATVNVGAGLVHRGTDNQLHIYALSGAAQSSSSSSSSSSASGAAIAATLVLWISIDGTWAQADLKSITKEELVTFTGLPAGVYKITATGVSGTLRLLEQHREE